MGQTFVSDQTTKMALSIPASNVSERKIYTKLLTYKCLEVPFFQKIFQYENYKKIQVTYKFFGNVLVHLEINKEKPKVQAGCPVTFGNEVVYGYKFKKNDKNDSIRPDKIFFRRKIFSSFLQSPNIRSIHREKIKNGIKNRNRSKEPPSSKEKKSTQIYQTKQAKEELIHKLAEMKLLSKLDIGTKMARIIDGADGSLTENYIEFYSQLPLESEEFEKRQPAEKDSLSTLLKKKGFKVNSDAIEMSYSVFQKKYILRESKATRSKQDNKKQNRGIKYLVRQCRDEINFIVNSLDGMTNMMSAIQNHLNYRQIDKAIEKFQNNIANMDETERLQYAQKMNLMLSKYKYYKTYQNEVSSLINSTISKQSSISESRNISSSRFQRRLRSEESEYSNTSSVSSFKSSRLSADYQSRSPISPVTITSKSNMAFRFSDSECSSPFCSPDKQKQLCSTDSFNFRDSRTRKQPFSMWETTLERLRCAINDNDKEGMNQSLTCLKNLSITSPIETQALYGRLLMENGKTKYAKILFQHLLYAKKTSKDAYICCQIENMLAFMYYCNGQQELALKHTEKALSERFKFRSYSRKTTLLFNNMAVLEFYLEKYEKSLLMLHRGFKLNQYCPDYELVMRSNYAMILAEKGQVKEAKMEMYKTFKNIEPYSNMEILCKFHSNLGYLQLLENVLDKAKNNFQIACEIENKYLLPNGYRPSVFLHNNFAITYSKTILHHKKVEWKKAIAHLMKIQNQLPELSGFTAVQVHFNFGKFLKQDYKPDSALDHFLLCRKILLKLKESTINRYLEKIDSEIDRLETEKIVEMSQQESIANKLSKVSRKSHISNKSKILN